MEIVVNDKSLLDCFEHFNKLKKTKIAVGVSGGIDSLSLVLLLNIWAKKYNSEIFAITVDHKLREESTEEAEYVHKICEQNGINHTILTWNEEKPLSNIEAVAREKRYNLISEYCKDNNIKYLCVAHHLEDQAETFFIRLFRGSGIDGLSSMAEETNLFGLNIIRPFLHIHKSQLKQFLLDNKIEWVEDSSNSDDKYLRNKIRNFLNSFENKEEITTRIGFAVNEITKCKNFIEKQIQEVEDDILDFSSFGMCLINTNNLLSIDEDLSLRLLAKTVMKISGNIYKPRLVKLTRLYNEIKESFLNENNLKYTFYGCIFEKYDTEKIVVYREYNSIGEDIKLEYNKEVIWDNRFKIKLIKPMENMTITHVKEGEFNKVLESIRLFDFSKYKELKLIKGIEKNVFYTLPIAKHNDKYLFDYFYVKMEKI